MNPLVKKVAAGLAIKEVIDRVQEARRPKRSFVGRNKSKALWAALLAGGAYLYKNGKLDSVISQAKGLTGRPSTPEPAAYPSGPTLETHGPISERTEADRPLEPSHN
jgi:hypothetical protein